MTEIKTDAMMTSQDYEARGIVSKIGVIGHVLHGPMQVPVYRFLTLDCGDQKPSMAVEFVRKADIMHDGTGPYLDITKMKEGEIVVTPGFVYRKIPWTTPLINAHLHALKTYKRKVIVKSEVDRSAPPVDLGVYDPHNITKQ
jgi:hypothetical protein